MLTSTKPRRRDKARIEAADQLQGRDQIQGREQLLGAAAGLRAILPGATLVGGMAAKIAAGRRGSLAGLWLAGASRRLPIGPLPSQSESPGWRIPAKTIP